MTKVGQRGYRAMTPAEQHRYVTPILPAAPQMYHPDLSADLDTPLTSRYAYDEVVKGTVDPSKYDQLRIYYPEAAFMDANPNVTMWQNNIDSSYGLAQKAYNGDVPENEKISPDGSNYRVGSSKTLHVPFTANQDNIYNVEPNMRTYFQPRANMRKPSSAGRLLADARNLTEAMSDWTSFTDGSVFHRSWYDDYPNGRSLLKGDAKMMSEALKASDGDVRKAFDLVKDSLSQPGADALYSIIGYYHNPESEKIGNIQKLTENRFWNGVDAANKYYDEYGGIPERRAWVYNAQFATPEQKRRYFGPTPEEEARLRGVNSYSRGGRLRVPKRNSFGDCVSRTDNLGTDEYDVYF